MIKLFLSFTLHILKLRLSLRLGYVVYSNVNDPESVRPSSADSYNII